MWGWIFLLFCGGVFLFLVMPLLVIVPLSFNAQPYFTFTSEMLRFDSEAFSFRWYEQFWLSDKWRSSLVNSFFIATVTAICASILGVLAALGLSRPEMPYRRLINAILISPLIVPIVVSAAGLFFFFAPLGLIGTFPGVIIAHTVLTLPFVVITVTATLVGFDKSLIRAGLMCGASPLRVFFQVTLPLILPGVLSGALFAFVISFDEVVVVLFVASVEQQTVPRQMWAGLREELSPIILAVATVLIGVSVVLLLMLEMLRRRSDRLRGVEET
jgi:putative spermidine/putrescine transport system permease protein